LRHFFSLLFLAFGAAGASLPDSGAGALSPASAPAPYLCGHRQIIKRPYGTVELVVHCAGKAKDSSISVLEYKKDDQVQHGFAVHYDRRADGRWLKRDSCMFVNGKENGRCLFWDTLGNVAKMETYRNGAHTGKRETYWAPGRPAVSKTYGANGKEHGPWLEWWENGNRKAEYSARNGRIVSATEYYRDGRPRLRYVKTFDANAAFKIQYKDGEAWAPNGASTGRIVNGAGSWILFPDGHDSADHAVFRELYQGKSLVAREMLDSASTAKWAAPPP
jgi:hypothetical protein